jgi:bacterioferritin
VKGHDDIIDLLNEILTAELTTINVYFLHARMCQNWGYDRMWAKIREESIDEMRHADALIERILHLEGLPNLQRLGSVSIGETVPEQLQISLGFERASITKLNQGIELCRNLGDNGSRELLEELLEGSEGSEAWFEAQLTLIDQVGEANYLARQILKDE